MRRGVPAHGPAAQLGWQQALLEAARGRGRLRVALRGGALPHAAGPTDVRQRRDAHLPHSGGGLVQVQAHGATAERVRRARGPAVISIIIVVVVFFVVFIVFNVVIVVCQ